MDPITEHFYGGYSGLSESIGLTTISDDKHVPTKRKTTEKKPKHSSETSEKPLKFQKEPVSHEDPEWNLTEVAHTRKSKLSGGNNIPINPYTVHPGQEYDGQVITGPSLDDRTMYRITGDPIESHRDRVASDSIEQRRDRITGDPIEQRQTKKPTEIKTTAKHQSDFKSPTKDDELHFLSESRIQSHLDQSSELMDKYANVKSLVGAAPTDTKAEEISEESISGISSESESTINFGMDEPMDGKRSKLSSEAVRNKPTTRRAKAEKKPVKRGIKIDLDENDLNNAAEEDIDDDINFTSVEQQRYGNKDRKPKRNRK
jgi:hypothetical protein